MDNKYVEMANGINLKSVKGMKEYTKKLIDLGVDNNNIYYNSALQSALECMDAYTFEVTQAMRLLKEEKELIAKYGDVAREYVEVFDKCVDLSLTHNYFDSVFNHTHNNYVLQMGNADLKMYPTLHSISVFEDRYNCTIRVENYNNYKEKCVHLNDFGVLGIKMVVKLLNEKVEEELKYREIMKWQGEMDVNAIVDMVKPLFPNLDISVRDGKRGCDGKIGNYTAIVVDKEESQLGSMILWIDNRGIANLTCRVPLCGESKHEVTNDSVLTDIVDGIKYMLS